MSQIDDRLRTLGIELPNASTPGANYVPFVRTGNLVFVTGQLSQWNGERRFIGKLGREFSIEEGQSAAHLCALTSSPSFASRSRGTSIAWCSARELRASSIQCPTS